jgi:S-formylglutathione hydrolase FrmB
MDRAPETSETGEAMPPVGNGHSARSLVLRVLAAALVVVVAVVVRDVVDEETAPSPTDGARVVDYTIDSQLLDQEMPVKVVIPPGAQDGRRSLLVFLHGRGEDENSYLVEPMFEALAKQRGKAPVVAFPRGGPDSYWHDRDDGEWGSYVLDELIPDLAERFEIEPERIAIGGISMGGFGAFDIARQAPDVFCTVGGHSPAVWVDASDTAPGAFDNEDDFDRHDVIAEVGPPGDPLAGKRIWLDVGDEDPFAEATGTLLQKLNEGGAQARLYEGKGGHESSYWDSNWKRYMQFYARALKKCQVKGRSDHKKQKPAQPKGEDAGEGEDVRAPS